MESAKELNVKILDITMIIQEKYPELLKYLGEMPVTIPDKKSPEIDCKNLREYYDSLSSILENYAREHLAEDKNEN
ncbi:MAG TPA: hypothetical protein VK870_04785 [Ignavibacteriaceae bacterium]|nr:hypothetical protein [Ignavibacteriaceae bacterium]